MNGFEKDDEARPAAEGLDFDNLYTQHFKSLRGVPQVRPDIVQVIANPALESIVIPSGWLAVSYLDIAANGSLASIDLSSLHAADGLYIATNPVLASVDLGLLETTDDLRIVDNPLLPLEPFDAVQTFRRIVQSGPLTPDQH